MMRYKATDALTALNTIERGISSVPYLRNPMREVWDSLEVLRGYLEQQLVVSEDAALPCPFCGGNPDPHGWFRGDGVTGPECEGCGATATSMEAWNTRTNESFAER